jgi:mevalonate kinase
VTTADAAGKAILLGEHAVVYGRPAIAVPVSGVRATADVDTLAPGEGLWLEAEDLGRRWLLGAEAEGGALALQVAVRNTLCKLGLAEGGPALRIRVRSQVPIARGLGSGTAVMTAIVRALAEHLGQRLTPQETSELVYQSEILLHGTPSGVDNTVVAYERPVYFARGQEIGFLQVGVALSLVIGDTGQVARTRDTVEIVRRQWLATPRSCEALFDEIGATVQDGKAALAAGDVERLGHLMDRNQELLGALGVSSPRLEGLITAARAAGARGAKLSGGGGGGCMIALVSEDQREAVLAALTSAGAQQVLGTTIC